MTYNTQWLVASVGEQSEAKWKSAAALDEHYRRVAAVIAAQAPDVVNLVEVTSAASVERLAAAVERIRPLGYRAYHVDGHDTALGQDIGVLSRRPLDRIDGQSIRHLHSTGRGSQWRADYQWRDEIRHTSVSKNALYGVTVAGRRVGFLGLHLIAHPDDPRRNAQRQAQAEVAGRMAAAELIARGYTPIVLGDLNDYDATIADADDRFSTKTRVVERLEDLDPGLPGPELVSAARALPKERRYTARWDGAPGGTALTMIDHVLVHRDLAAFITAVTIPHAEADGASDHWPVVVDFDLPAARRKPLSLAPGVQPTATCCAGPGSARTASPPSRWHSRAGSRIEFVSRSAAAER
ncbi:MAG: endonuclease/exonuclease/phosphatase family protein [Magnetospirillum sp.]|nr:endonuclease/exonuclease/phosphatase family protein [Magnetospirillum sp.]